MRDDSIVLCFNVVLSLDNVFGFSVHDGRSREGNQKKQSCIVDFYYSKMLPKKSPL